VQGRYSESTTINFPRRPPGMRRRRYYRLRGRAADIEAKLLGCWPTAGCKVRKIDTPVNWVTGALDPQELSMAHNLRSSTNDDHL
jgi:hypothetical protein